MKKLLFLSLLFAACTAKQKPKDAAPKAVDTTATTAITARVDTTKAADSTKISPKKAKSVKLLIKDTAHYRLDAAFDRVNINGALYSLQFYRDRFDRSARPFFDNSDNLELPITYDTLYHI